MTTVFVVCAALGTVVLLVQFVLSMTGVFGDEFDADLPEADSSFFFSALSFRSLIAAVAFFGLGGLAAEQAGLSAYGSLTLGLMAAIAAMLVVAWLMRMLHSLHSEGNVRIDRAVGMPAVVYLTIPGKRSGPGKVTVTVQNRTMEYTAITSEDELKTGTPVVVVGIIDSGTLEVAPAYNNVSEGTQHE